MEEEHSLVAKQGVSDTMEEVSGGELCVWYKCFYWGRIVTEQSLLILDECQDHQAGQDWFDQHR